MAMVSLPELGRVVRDLGARGTAASATGRDHAQQVATVVAAARSRLGWGRWTWWTSAAVVVASLAYTAAYLWLLPECQRSAVCQRGQVFRVSSDYSVFAALFVLSLAVERLMEPFSRFIGPDTDERRDARDAAHAKAFDDPDPTHTQELADRQADLDKAREASSIIAWGVAVGVSFVLAAKLNVLLLAAIAAHGSARPSPWADLLVTGLVIGAGTKPLHDLVAGIQRSKEAKQDPTATGGAAG